MPVFISHRTKDDKLAQNVFYHLHTIHNIKCYLDDFDRFTNEAQRTNRITELILDRLEECSHLLAIVTENTEGSWWVPFEIGVARRAPRIISTFTNLEKSALPEYLNDWPVLRNTDGLRQYGYIYNTYKDRTDRRLTNRALRENVTFSQQVDLTEQVHDRLKIMTR